MSENGIPRQDALAVNYINTFANTIAADPAAYMLQVADAAALQLAASNLQSVYTAATTPATRNELTIAHKDEMRTAAEALVRLYAIQIKYNQAISTADKEAIGVSQPNPSRSPRPVPATQPTLSVKGALTGSHTVTFVDSLNDKKAKPFGAQTVELRVAITEEGTSDVNLAKTYGLFSKNPIGVAFEHEDNQKTATYWARWANVRGQVGPWSNPVSMTIAA